MKIMTIRLTMRLIILLFILPLSACSTHPPHKVNIDAIDANKNKTFNIGIVKVAGRIPLPGGDLLERKKIILEKIPVKEICNVLADNYGLKINTDINRTIRTVKEKLERQGRIGSLASGISVDIFMMSENPYWGNKEYSEPGFLRSAFSECPTIIDEDFGDTIYITYGLRTGGIPWALKDEFYYEIVVKSDAEMLMQHKGIVATVDTPKSGLILDSEGVWNNFTFYTEKIPEAFARDIHASEE